MSYTFADERRRRPKTKAQRRDPEVPDTPEAREHAKEADDVRDLLDELGVVPERVAPTRDGRGHVRLDFEGLYKLIYEDDED